MGVRLSRMPQWIFWGLLLFLIAMALAQEWRFRSLAFVGLGTDAAFFGGREVVLPESFNAITWDFGNLIVTRITHSDRYYGDSDHQLYLLADLGSFPDARHLLRYKNCSRLYATCEHYVHQSWGTGNKGECASASIGEDQGGRRVALVVSLPANRGVIYFQGLDRNLERYREVLETLAAGIGEGPGDLGKCIETPVDT